ncbi:hypothetical protein Peur_046943 [Populus x canadensis]
MRKGRRPLLGLVISSDQQFLHGFRSSDSFLNQGEMQGDQLHRAAILVRKRKCGFLSYSRMCNSILLLLQMVMARWRGFVWPGAS